MLRIHDYKSGTVPGHMEQLQIYAALFCLEYKIRPSDIDMELRIYQEPIPICCVPLSEDILLITQKIIAFDKILNKIKIEES